MTPSIASLTLILLAICFVNYVSRQLGRPRFQGINYLPYIGTAVGAFYAGYLLGKYSRNKVEGEV
jgi:hypothetical protein